MISLMSRLSYVCIDEAKNIFGLYKHSHTDIKLFQLTIFDVIRVRIHGTSLAFSVSFLETRTWLR